MGAIREKTEDVKEQSDSYKYRACSPSGGLPGPGAGEDPDLAGNVLLDLPSDLQKEAGRC